MSSEPVADISVENALSRSMGRVERLLERYAATVAPDTDKTDLPAVDSAENIEENRSALGHLMRLFDLSPWECDTLILCAGVELSAHFATLCARINGDPRSAYPTFGIALAALPGAHWDGLHPGSPLRKWNLVTVAGLGDTNASLTRNPLRANERIIHYLADTVSDDETVTSSTLTTVLSYLTLQNPPELPPTDSQSALAAKTAALFTDSPGGLSLPIPFLIGDDEDGKEAVAARIAERVGIPLLRLDAAEIPSLISDAETRIVALCCEARLHRFLLLLDMREIASGTGGEVGQTPISPGLRRFIERYDAPLLLLPPSHERPNLPRRLLIPIEIPRLRVSERIQLWQDIFHSSGTGKSSKNDTVEGIGTEELSIALAGQFSLSAVQIRSAALDRFTVSDSKPKTASETAVWQACRRQARPRLDDLAQRIESQPTWDDLSLPDAQKSVLNDLLAHVRQREKVHDEWGWMRRGARGLGLSALFAGTSGTGKTLAAEVVAHALQLDLYRVDLSQTISKYIGETEKNLARIFDAAEVGSVILLFDEADALFGKRSEVQDSHDRYANIEVSYLLQRMERYRGLAILTTNMKNALDTAFLRRLRFVVNFPFPDFVQREAIWRRVFPPETPLDTVSFSRLAQWSVAGGNIKSAALNAAFLAADEGKKVGMRHLLRAAQMECAKLDRPLIEAEIAGWVSEA